MINVGDIYESDVATYEIVRETPCKWYIKRTNKNNHPCSPNKEFPVRGTWKKIFHVDNLKKIK